MLESLSVVGDQDEDSQTQNTLLDSATINFEL